MKADSSQAENALVPARRELNRADGPYPFGRNGTLAVNLPGRQKVKKRKNFFFKKRSKKLLLNASKQVVHKGQHGAGRPR
jgi:hypothetical protein